MNRRGDRDMRLRTANMTAGAALARDAGTTYLGQRGKRFKFAQIRPDFVNYELAALLRPVLRTWAGRGRAEPRECMKIVVSPGCGFRHHFAIPTG